MSSKNDNEMEQIQQGLEAFLEKELDIIDTPQGERRSRRPQEGRNRRITGQQDNRGHKEPVRQERTPTYGNRVRQEANRDYRNYGQADEYWDDRNYTPEDEYRDDRNYTPEDEHQDDRNYAPEDEYWNDGNSEPEDEDWDYEEPAYQRESHVKTNLTPRSSSHRNPEKSGAERGRRSTQGRPQATRESGSRTRAGSGRGERYPEAAAYSEPDSPGEVKSKKKKRSKVQKQISQEDVQMAKKPPKSTKGQKKKKKKSELKKFLIVVFLLVALLGVGLYQLVGVVYGKMNYGEIASVTDQPMQEDGVVNILLIGNDSRENGADGRSDAMILLSISSKTKKIYLTSLLRDMYVEIPGHDDNRLNAAYSFGGAELLMETVEKNFDIPVNRYMLVNFEGFANLVDTVGGIELDLTSEEIEYVNGYLVEYNMLTGRPQGTDNMDTSASGPVHLNGPQALAYSRNRYLGTDFGRTDRQRKVLTAVIQKIPSVMLTNAGELMDGLLPNLTTNLTRNECFRLSLMAGKLLTYEIVSDSIPQPGTYSDATIRKMAVLEIDFETNIKYLKEKLYGE